MFLMVWKASSLQPPKDSMTREMKVTPAARQAPADIEHILAGVVEAPASVCCCMVDITCMSRAAG